MLQHIPDELKDSQSLCSLPDSSEYTKTLRIEWNTCMDHFRINIAKLPPLRNINKRLLVSSVAKTFDILDWFSPGTIKMKILCQQLWELKIGWDDPVPEPVRETWMRWRSELTLLSTKYIPRCYHSMESDINSIELHCFSDASEQAYVAILYLRISIDGSIRALVSAKAKVTLIRRITIPRLELCEAHLLAQLMDHVRLVYFVHILLNRIRGMINLAIETQLFVNILNSLNCVCCLLKTQSLAGGMFMSILAFVVYISLFNLCACSAFEYV